MSALQCEGCLKVALNTRLSTALMANRKAELRAQLRAVLFSVRAPSTPWRDGVNHIQRAHAQPMCEIAARRQVDREPTCSPLLLCIRQIHPPIKCNAVHSLKCQSPRPQTQPQDSCSTAATRLKPESSPGRSGPACSSVSANLWLPLKTCLNLEAVVEQGPSPLSTHSQQLCLANTEHTTKGSACKHGCRFVFLIERLEEID